MAKLSGRILIFIGMLLAFLPTRLSLAVAPPTKPLSISPYFRREGISKSSSFCYVHRDQDFIDGQNLRRKVKIASVSKLFTSYYVLSTLGPEYRFQTQFIYDQDTKDLYVLGSHDPFMGQRSLQFVVSELNSQGITEIRKLIFDSKFSVYLDVEVAGPQMWNDGVMPGEVRYRGRDPKLTKRDLRSFLSMLRVGYRNLRAAVAKNEIEMVERIQLKVKEIVPATGELKPEIAHPQKFTYRSAPLLRYVKSLNVHSNNYVADELIAATGGIGKLNQFFAENLGFSEEDFEFYTGSGLWKNWPEVPGYDMVRTRSAKDNLATCEAVMNVLSGLDRLTQKHHLQMSDIVMVPSRDRGSLTMFQVYRSNELTNAVLAKTGTLNQANALAGEISAESGNYFFGIFFETDSRTATNSANVYRDQLLKRLVTEVGGGGEPILYEPLEFYPFDKFSGFMSQGEPLGSKSVLFEK